MTDSYLINSATFLLCIFAAVFAYGGIDQLLTWIGLPVGFANLVGFVAALAAFFAVLYGYYLLFLADEDRDDAPDAEPALEESPDPSVVGTRSFRK